MNEYALNAGSLDAAVIIGYFVLLLAVGLWQGRKSRDSSGHYFFSKGTLPWWAIGMAYVAAGMNTEQLVGQNGMGYTHGLVMVNWYYTVVVFVYSALIFVFFPIYLRNNVQTMPEFLGTPFRPRKPKRVRRHTAGQLYLFEPGGGFLRWSEDIAGHFSPGRRRYANCWLGFGKRYF